MFKGAINSYGTYSIGHNDDNTEDHVVAISDFGEIRSQKISEKQNYLESKVLNLELEMNEIMEGDLSVCSKDSYIVAHSVNIEIESPEHLFIVKIQKNNFF